MGYHEIKFCCNVRRKYLKVRVKAILIAHGVTAPVTVKVLTPDKEYCIKVT